MNNKSNIQRNSFQGVINIIRFNWHFYIFAIIFIILLHFSKSYLPTNLGFFISLIIFFTILSTFISLLISYYIYDFSNLYSLSFLDKLAIHKPKKIVNISAGFDETSLIIGSKFPTANLQIFDFYDPKKHTEISIERARKAYPELPNTEKINTNNIPLESNSIDYIFLIFAAHEIRNDEERIVFFKQLANALNTNNSQNNSQNSRIIVVEHLRDINNFFAYNLGFMHFLSHKNWKNTFEKANLLIETEQKITPFISTFILYKNGITS